MIEDFGGGMPPVNPLMGGQTPPNPMLGDFVPPNPVVPGALEPSGGQETVEPERPERLKLSAEKRKDLTDWICAAIERARGDSGRRELLDRTRRCNDLYEGKTVPKTFPWPGCANVFVPLVNTRTDGVAVRLTRAILYADPIVICKPVMETPEAVEAAKTQERWLQDILVNVLAVREVGADVLFNATKEPVGITALTWRSQERKKTGVEFTAENAYLIEERQRFVGPKLECVSIEDFEIIPANARSFDDAVGVLRRHWMRWDDLKRGEAAGLYQDVERVKTESEVNDSTAPLRSSQDEMEGVSDGVGEGRLEERHFEVYEGLWRYDVDDDGIEEQLLVTVALHERVALRIEHYPYLHNEPYFHRWRIKRRPNRWYGQCIPEKLESLQRETNSIHNQRLDAMTLGLAPPIMGNQSELAHAGTPLNIKAYPGNIIWLNDVKNGLVPLALSQPNPATFTEEQVLTRYADDATSITEQKLGRPASGRRTLGEMLEVMMEANAGIEDMISTAAGTLPTLCFQIVSLYRQFRGSYPSWGPMEFLDTPMVYIPNSSVAAANRQRQEETGLRTYTLMMANPIVQQDPKKVWAVTRSLLQRLGERDIDGMIGKEPAEGAMPMLPPGMAGGGGAGGGQGGGQSQLQNAVRGILGG